MKDRQTRESSPLDAFFKPKSVAIVGASSDPKKPGYTALKNLVSMGYQGKVFPINPREDSILGFRCYKSVLDIPEPVEACVLLVSADLTMQVANELVQRKRRFNDVTGSRVHVGGFWRTQHQRGKAAREGTCPDPPVSLDKTHRPELRWNDRCLQRIQHQFRYSVLPQGRIEHSDTKRCIGDLVPVLGREACVWSD